MVVVCIDTNDLIHGPIQNLLTIGKSYNVLEVLEENGKSEMYLVVDDRGQRATYRCDRFIDLSKVRAEKLQELGI